MEELIKELEETCKSFCGQEFDHLNILRIECAIKDTIYKHIPDINSFIIKDDMNIHIDKAFLNEYEDIIVLLPFIIDLNQDELYTIYTDVYYCRFSYYKNINVPNNYRYNVALTGFEDGNYFVQDVISMH